ncbi:MAG: hypothetical protein J0H98_10020 [Solirubrobacterales bacterium]|nr:hypothetical protein [Solirubrobacterales bacterium]
MNVLRKAAAGAMIVAVGVGALASSANAAAVTEPPLRVKISPFAGKKVKVAKRLKVLVNCSKDCVAKVRVTLISPSGNATVKGGRKLAANRTWVTGMVLTSFGVNILKNHYRQSRLKVAVVARDVSTNKITRNTKKFGFRR